MSRMNLNPAFRYRFGIAARGAGVFTGIMVAIVILGSGSIYYASWNGSQVSGNFSVFGISATIAMFVTGICTIREDLRLMIQNGVGRRTVFAAELLVIGSFSFLLAAAGELILLVTQWATSGWKNFYYTDLFQIIFFREMEQGLTFAAHIQSLLCFFGLYLCASLTGTLISLIFYRLNKLWTVIVAVGTPLFVFVGLPLLIGWKLIPDFISTAVLWVFTFSFRSPWTMLTAQSVAAALIAALCWLLLRRAPVKPAK